MGIRKSILPLGLAVILVSVMATAAIIGSTPSAFAQITITPGKNVLTIEADRPIINKINPVTGATISSVEITLDPVTFAAELADEDFEVTGGTGIEFNPDDGKIYALIKIALKGSFGLDRHLVTIDLQTGIATKVGDTGEKKIASLTFNPGTLYSVKLGDKNEVPPEDNTLSTISTVDGSVTTKCDLDAGFGTGLAHNPDDGFLYYATGATGATGSTGIFQRIDDFTVDPCVVTDIPTNLALDNPEALAFFSSFLITNFVFPVDEELSSITAAGFVSPIGPLDHFTRGLTVIPVSAIGGDMIQMETTSILAAGAQYTAAWMIPVIVSGIGFAIVIARKF